MRADSMSSLIVVEGERCGSLEVGFENMRRSCSSFFLLFSSFSPSLSLLLFPTPSLYPPHQLL
jgi:hypothetical protein